MATCSHANPSIPLPVGYKQANPGMVQSHTAELCLAAPPVVTSALWRQPKPGCCTPKVLSSTAVPA